MRAVRGLGFLTLLLGLPLRAWALPDFALSTDELPLGGAVDVTIRLLSDENVNAWEGLWSVDPAEIEILGIIAADPGTFVSSDSTRFSLNGFTPYGQPGGFDLATVTLRRLTEGGSIEMNRGAIGEVTGDHTYVGTHAWVPPKKPPPSGNETDVAPAPIVEINPSLVEINPSLPFKVFRPITREEWGPLVSHSDSNGILASLFAFVDGGLTFEPTAPTPRRSARVVPEPGTIALLGLGLLGLVWMRRRSL